MTEKQARERTKYFCAGVSVVVSCYAGDGNWDIRIHRNNTTATFSGLDGLKRELQELYQRLESKSALEMWPEHTDSYTQPVIFYSNEDVIECVAAIRNALIYLQSVSREKCWREVPDMFQAFANYRELSNGPL